MKFQGQNRQQRLLVVMVMAVVGDRRQFVPGKTTQQSAWRERVRPRMGVPGKAGS